MSDWLYVAVGAGMCLYLTYKAAFVGLAWALKRWGEEGEQGA
jgi:hypothetical protein